MPALTTSAAGAAAPVARSAFDVAAAARSLWAQRQLIRQFVRREVQGRYRGSTLGLLWSFVNPLLLLALYTFVFGLVFRARWPQFTSGRLSEFALVLFCGLLVLNLFGECLSRSPGLVLGQPSYVKRVVFPLEILPVVAVGNALFNGGVGLIVLVLANLTLNGELPWTLVFTPLVLLPIVLLTLGVSWTLASLGVFLRDLPYVVALLLQILTFATPIFYPVEALPDWARPIILANPLTPAVDDLRRVALWGQMPDWPRLAVSLLGGVTVLVLGHAWFARTRRAFADVL